VEIRCGAAGVLDDKTLEALSPHSELSSFEVSKLQSFTKGMTHFVEALRNGGYLGETDLRRYLERAKEGFVKIDEMSDDDDYPDSLDEEL
jgi:hypothetical protein